MQTTQTLIDIVAVRKAALALRPTVEITPLQINLTASDAFGANVYFKREDLQIVRSYKIRGALNKMMSLTPDERKRGVVCASAGNHAQGVAYACKQLGIRGTIIMAGTTPRQKIDQVRMFGKDMVDIKLHGDTFDEAFDVATAFCVANDHVFIHPFDDLKIIEGQATVAHEILNQAECHIDYIFVPLGGGGLAAGISGYSKQISPSTQVIGVEPAGAPSMTAAWGAGELVSLDTIDKFIDGAAVKTVGEETYRICREHLDAVTTVEEGKVCSTILQLYTRDAIVVEPAGAMALAALDQYRDDIAGKNVVCILSGSNNDITRMEEIKERSMLYEGLKHYFMVSFPQRAGALKEFVNEVLGPDDDITFFEYAKKHNREAGPAIIGIELKNADDFAPLKQRMVDNHFFREHLNGKENLFHLLV
jgi:threonine dehydratase